METPTPLSSRFHQLRTKKYIILIHMFLPKKCDKYFEDPLRQPAKFLKVKAIFDESTCRCIGPKSRIKSFEMQKVLIAPEI